MSTYRAAMEWWLRELQERRGLQSLLGENVGQVLEGAEMYDALGKSKTTYVHYCAEVPLMGNAGTDLTVAYRPTVFYLKNPFVGRSSEKLGELLTNYSRLVLPRYARQDFALHFELDTFSGDASCASVFMGLPEGLRHVEWQGLLRLMPELAVAKNLQGELAIRQPAFRLKTIGLMLSRAGSGIRMIVRPAKGGMEEVLKLLRIEGHCDVDRELIKRLLKFERDYLISANCAFDVQSDGRFGSKWGLEVNLNRIFVGEATALLQSSPFKELCRLWQDMGLADERLDLVERAVFDEAAPAGFTGRRLLSRLNHIKLSWLEGTPQRAKLYLAATIL